MHHIHVMQSFESFHGLNNNLPDLFVLKQSSILLVLSNSLVEITIVCVFHYNAQGTVFFVNKDLFVTSYVFTADACQDSNFINCICTLFLCQGGQINLLQGIFF